MSKKMRAIIRLALVTAGLVAVAMFGAAAYAQALGNQAEPVEAPAVVLCETEDSCTVDYRDGAWHITRVVP